jgi:sialic acid synthase SpsE
MPERPFAVYPLRFKEIYKDKIWGGPELAKVIGKKAQRNIERGEHLRWTDLA